MTQPKQREWALSYVPRWHSAISKQKAALNRLAARQRLRVKARNWMQTLCRNACALWFLTNRREQATLQLIPNK